MAKLHRYASCMCSVTFEVDVAADSSKYQNDDLGEVGTNGVNQRSIDTGSRNATPVGPHKGML